jgi:hypothetical protein
MELDNTWVKEEIRNLKNENIKKFLIEALKATPRSFFVKSASSSMKYHPFFSNVESGLLSGHCRFMWIIARNLSELYELSQDDKESMFAAVILHDSFKYVTVNGKDSAYTSKEHAKIAFDNLKRCVMGGDNEKNKENILECVRYHMYRWSSPKSEEIGARESARKSIMVRIIQEADYLSSRKEIVDFVLQIKDRLALEK